jgi:1-acyl-sn-glycerol-3-phosphate acyltransferase
MMQAFCYALSKFILWVLFRFRYGLQVRGQEHVPRRGPFIVASNHISFLDPPLIGVACPRRLRFMARADLFHKPLLGFYLRSVGVMPLKRGEADVAAMRAALARLERGEPVAIFPEGTRQLTGRLGTAKRGIGLLAVAARVPIVPALVQGTREALPPDATRLQKAKIRVAFGPLVAYTDSSVPATPSGEPPTEGKGSGRARHEQLAEAVTQSWRRLEEQLRA